MMKNMADIQIYVLFKGLILFVGLGTCVYAENVTANAGETAILICPESSDLNITIWIGPSGIMYNAPGSTEIRDIVPDAERLEINGTNAALLIHNVTLDDEGIYTCIATNVGEAELQLTVTNIAPATIEFKDTQLHNNLTIIRGVEDQTVMLTCLANGAKPKPNITWSRTDTNETFFSNDSFSEDGNGRFDVTSSFTLLANRSLDGVEFRCTVVHPALDIPKKVVAELYLDLKPVVRQTKDKTVTVEGYNVTISCDVFDARPAANISLFFDGRQESDFDDNNVVYNVSSETYTSSTKFYKVMNRSDNEKTVTCMINHLALDKTINKTWIVAVHYPPSASISGENVSSLSGSFSLNCLADGGNPQNYTFSLWQHSWFSDSNILREVNSTSLESNKATLKLSNITFQDSGFYRCFVANGIGTVRNPAYAAEKEIYIFVKDTPFVVDGRTQYHSSTDEKIVIVIDVYTNVEPLYVTIEENLETTDTTAVWTIRDNVPKTMVVPVYQQEVFMSGFRISAEFEVQADKNYGNYKVVIRNDIGSSSHHFTVLPREIPTTGVPAGQDKDSTNTAAIVAGTVVPVVVVIVIITAIVLYCKCRRNPTPRPPLPKNIHAGKKYIPGSKEQGNLYDYINPGGEGYISPTARSKSPDAKDDGYMEPGSPKFKAEYWEYTKGDEKVVYKKIEGRGLDQIDMSGSMKLPSLTMTAAPVQADPEQDSSDDHLGPHNLRSLSIEEMPEMTEGYISMTGKLDQPDSLQTSSPDIEEVD